MEELGYTFREAPQTMMDRLRERDEERERIAKAEQLKLEPDAKTYNTMLAAGSAPAAAHRSEVVEQKSGSDEFSKMAQEVEDSFGLASLEARVSALEAVS